MRESILDAVIRKLPTELQHRDAIVSELQARAAQGQKKYGVPLMPNNGRDSLQDFIEEIMDSLMYLEQSVAEGKFKHDPTLAETLQKSLVISIEQAYTLRRTAPTKVYTGNCVDSPKSMYADMLMRLNETQWLSFFAGSETSVSPSGERVFVCEMTFEGKQYNGRKNGNDRRNAAWACYAVWLQIIEDHPELGKPLSKRVQLSTL